MSVKKNGKKRPFSANQGYPLCRGECECLRALLACAFEHIPPSDALAIRIGDVLGYSQCHVTQAATQTKTLEHLGGLLGKPSHAAPPPSSVCPEGLYDYLTELGVVQPKNKEQPP